MQQQNTEINSKNTKILISCHKPCELPPNKDGLFLPIHVGAAVSDVDLKMQRDDEVLGQPCDNISAKHKHYSEITAYYWAWKNIKRLYPDLEYIGFCHYRRYFNFAKKGAFWHQESRNIPARRLKDAEPLIDLKEPIRGCDVILPVSVPMPIPKSRNMNFLNNGLDDRIFEAVILRLHPNYKDDLIRICYKTFELPFRNMFVMKWDLFERYAEWLFGIIFEAEKIIKFAPYEGDTRWFGYNSEVLLSLFCLHNKVSVKRRQFLFVDEAKSPSVLKSLYGYVLTRLRFTFNTFSLHGVQLVSESKRWQGMFKSRGVWDQIEQIKPVD